VPRSLPSINFRPNPGRAVYVQGSIDQSLIDRLTPSILNFHYQSRDPVSVYIDSPGGNTLSAELLLRMLSAPNQEFTSSCRLITVVTGRAASAAADLLSAGDYAIAYPGSTIYYHGVRTSPAVPVTVEVASYLTESLKVSNDKYALQLARRSFGRFIFQYVNRRFQFPTVRQQQNNSKLTDLECFTAMASQAVSEAARVVIDQARIRNLRYNALLKHLQRTVFNKRKVTKLTRFAQVEAAMLKGIVEFELGNNKDSEWTFKENGGLAKISDDFLLLTEYHAPHLNDQLAHLCDRWGDYFLTATETEQLNAFSDEERPSKRQEMLKQHFQPLWFFFVALCHALQEGENELTAIDAFRLGLIDEVVGHADVPTLRMWAEFRPDETDTAAVATA